jgi:hypothetical protein
MRHEGDYKTLAEALKHSGGGLELEVRSSLPVGSGRLQRERILIFARSIFYFGLLEVLSGLYVVER